MNSRSPNALPVGLAVLPLLGLVVGWWLAPEATARWAAKEGPVEHASHLVLAAALVGWSGKAGRQRGLAIVVALWCAVVLAEELDWGAVYGLRGIADVWITLVGRPDFHNAWGGGSYVLFGVPIVGLAIAGWLERGGVTRGDAIALAVIVGGSVVGTLASAAIEPLLDEVAELSLYLVLGVMGWRSGSSRTTARTPRGSGARRPCSG